MSYVTKDSGKRAEFDGGMVRDTEDGKARFDLLLPEGVPYADQFLTRCAELMARGAAKYDTRNWEKANDEDACARYRSSALRHAMQWVTGDEDEDHAAAVLFNLLAHETTRWKIAQRRQARYTERAGAPAGVVRRHNRTVLQRGRRSALGDPAVLWWLDELDRGLSAAIEEAYSAATRPELDDAAEAVAPDYVARLRATFGVAEPEPEPEHGAVVDSWTVYTRTGATLHKIHRDGEYTVEPLA